MRAGMSTQVHRFVVLSKHKICDCLKLNSLVFEPVLK